MKTTLARLGAAVLLSSFAPPFASPVLAQGGLEEEPIPPSFPEGRKAPAGPAAVAPEESVAATPPPAAPSGAFTAVPDSYLPSLIGPIGLYHISTAEAGPENHLRLALHGEYFSTSDFLVKGDSNSRVDGDFTFGYTPSKYVEIFGALLTSSNRNHRSGASEPPRRDPELIKSFGDLVLGPKVVGTVTPGVTAGFELGLRFLSSISDLSFSPSSTSVWIGPVATIDLRPVSKVPLRFHVNANYYLDKSKNLIDFSDPTISIFTREVASFAYGIAKSRARFALGMDAPLEKLTDPVPLQLFAEYHIEVVLPQDKDQAFVQAGFTMPDNPDQQWVTLGMRARLYRGLTADVGSDIRIRSVGYAFGPPLPPWNLVFGMAYPFDIEAFRRPVVVTRTIEKQAPPPPAPEEGRIAGAVTNAKDGKPVGGAIVAVNGRPRSGVVTDPDGTFLTAPLPPGPADLEITASKYEANTVKTAVMAGSKPVQVEVTLTPKVMSGNVRGKISDGKGAALQASLRFAGVEVFEAKSDASGAFSAALPPGPYRVTADAPGFPTKEVPLDISEGKDQGLDIVMRTPNPDVTLAGDAITLRQPIKFKGGPPKLDTKAQNELDGVADLLADHPDIRTLKVEVHWDASAGKGAQAITDKQAGLIKDYLVKKGVSEGRVEAAGMGADHPLVPNIGPANKAKNRRVELKPVR
jgi:outer membrane protein OmpA-like peptidoglycan-associated protein